MQSPQTPQSPERIAEPRTTRPASLHFLFFLMAVCILPGCTTSFQQWVDQGFKVGPDYCEPPAPTSPQWIDFGKDPRISSDPVDPRCWWANFNDPKLDALMKHATRKNLTLRMAGERIQQAQAARNVVAGNLFPQTQQVFADFTRNQFSQTVANPPTQTAHFDQWDTGLNLSWELDFWGRYRRAIEAADATLDAAMADYDSVSVIMLAQVAQSYINIRTYQERLRLARENVKSTQRILDVAQTKFDARVISKLDLLQSQNNVAQAKALIDRLELGLRTENNALCILLGVPPVDLTDDPAVGEGTLPEAPEQVAVGIPAELLERRPDVRMAERLAAAQSARIGIAESELYPHLAINGVFQLQSENLDQLFNPKSQEFIVGPSLRWNVLNYGRIRNAVYGEEARFRELVYAYQSTVLTAGREVEDGINGFRKSQDQERNLQNAIKSLEEAIELCLIEAKEGGKDYNRIYVVQQQKTQQEDEWARTKGDILLSLVRIYQALGGGW